LWPWPDESYIVVPVWLFMCHSPTTVLPAAAPAVTIAVPSMATARTGAAIALRANLDM
jgi:hypothetical protein